MRCLRHLELFVATPASQNAEHLDGISHSNVLGAFEVCLNYQAIQKTYLAIFYSMLKLGKFPSYKTKLVFWIAWYSKQTSNTSTTFE